MSNQGDWHVVDVDGFWKNVAPDEHVVQIYEDDENFIQLLAAFTISGIKAGEAVIIIASSNHLDALAIQLQKSSLDIQNLIDQQLYFPLNAEETLAKFMKNSWPDETLFNEHMLDLLDKAGSNGRKVRAFGEMVVILWSEGLTRATVHLEHLWNLLAKKRSFSLYCAYPRSIFMQDGNSSIMHICKSHQRLIALNNNKDDEVYYMNVSHDQNDQRWLF